MSVDQQTRRDAAIQRAREYSRFRSAGLQGEGLHLVVLLAELEQAERERDAIRGLDAYTEWQRAEMWRRKANEVRVRLAKVPALAKWTHHHSQCARVLDAAECDCGLNDAWRDLGIPEAK